MTFLASNDRRGGATAVRTSGLKELIWKVTLPESVRSSPVLRDGVLYVTCRNGILYALDSRGGKERWTYQAGRRAALDAVALGQSRVVRR